MFSLDLTGISRRRPAEPSHARIAVEPLETRVVPYSVSGSAWPHPQLITLSFVPDGTNLGGVTSNLFSTFNAKWATNVWQTQILRAAQVWAQQANINFAVVADSGAAIASGSYEQGDPSMGDIRISGANLGSNTLAYGYLPPPANNYSIAGDIEFNTAQVFNIGSTYDLFTVAVHEFGHALGLTHSTDPTAVMYGTYARVRNALGSDDSAGIQAVYGARIPDRFDAAGSDNSFATAANLNGLIDPNSLTAQATNLDITTTSDVDYYTFTAPSANSGALTVTVQSTGLSLLAPTLTVYAADQSTVLASASGFRRYGTTLSATIGNISAGQRFYVKVAGADASAFGTGAYALTLNFGTGSSPAAPAPKTQTAATGSPQTYGGQPNDTLIPNNVVTNIVFTVLGGALSIGSASEDGDGTHGDGFQIGTPHDHGAWIGHGGMLAQSGGASPAIQITPRANPIAVPIPATLLASPSQVGLDRFSALPGLGWSATPLDPPSSSENRAAPLGTVLSQSHASDTLPRTQADAGADDDAIDAIGDPKKSKDADAVPMPSEEGASGFVDPIAQVLSEVKVDGADISWPHAMSVAAFVGGTMLFQRDPAAHRLHAGRGRSGQEERRRATRYPCWLDGCCWRLGGSVLGSYPSIARDLSTGGINLLVRSPLEEGSLLALELEGAGEGGGRFVLIRVAHTQEESRGRWQLGCSFERALDEEEVHGLLFGRPDSAHSA